MFHPSVSCGPKADEGAPGKIYTGTVSHKKKKKIILGIAYSDILGYDHGLRRLVDSDCLAFDGIMERVGKSIYIILLPAALSDQPFK